MSAVSVSYDLALHGKILSRVKDITLELASASGSVLSQSLPLVVAAVGSDIESSHQVWEQVYSKFVGYSQAGIERSRETGCRSNATPSTSTPLEAPSPSQ